MDDKLTESETRKEKLAEEAEDRIRKGAHWADWMYVADGVAVGSAKAMRAAGTNRPYGKAYTRAFGAWLDEHPWARRVDKGTRSVLLWVADHRSEVEAWRETLAQNVRDKMNHPTTLKRKYDAEHRTSAPDPNAPKTETKVEALVRENATLWAENAKLKRDLAKGDAGSLFDLRETPVKDIAEVIARTISLDRLKRLQKEISAQIGARKLTAQAS